MEPARNRIVLAAQEFDRVNQSYRECEEHEKSYWRNCLQKAEDRLQRAVDNYESIYNGPLLTPEENERLNREDAAEDKP